MSLNDCGHGQENQGPWITNNPLHEDISEAEDLFAVASNTDEQVEVVQVGSPIPKKKQPASKEASTSVK